LYDCDAKLLLNVCIYLVFVGEEWLSLVSSHLRHLRELCLLGCDNLRGEYLEELMADLPELGVIK
jgi:hypothetical protein